MTILVVLWLFALGLGVRIHYCFDHQPQSLAPHVDMLSMHVDNEIDGHHKDVNVAYAFSVKIVKVELPAILMMAFLWLLILFKEPVFFLLRYTKFLQLIVGLRPQLRAPPHFPA